jgi:hypothetical protein
MDFLAILEGFKRKVLEEKEKGNKKTKDFNPFQRGRQDEQRFMSVLFEFS